MVDYLMKRVRVCCGTRKGIETLEWIAIAVLIIVGVAVRRVSQALLRTAVGTAITTFQYLDTPG